MGKLNTLVNQRHAAITRLGDMRSSSSKGGMSKEILDTQIAEMETEIKEVAAVWGPALRAERSIVLGECLS